MVKLVSNSDPAISVPLLAHRVSVEEEPSDEREGADEGSLREL